MCKYLAYLDSLELGIKHLKQWCLNEAARTKLVRTVARFARIVVKFLVVMFSTVLVQSFSYR